MMYGGFGNFGQAMPASAFAALTGGQASPPGLGMMGKGAYGGGGFGGSAPSGGGTKSKLCSNFSATGACRYNEKCTFAHGEHELGTPYVGGGGGKGGKMGKMMGMMKGKDGMGKGKMMQMMQMLGVKGKGKGGGFGGVIKKTKLCQNFPLGQCQYGDKCTFAHGDHELGSFSSGPNDLKTKICTRWQQGQCSKPGCTFAHGEHELGTKQWPEAPGGAWGGGNGIKTKLCTHFQAGSCTRAVCTFAHGEAELGKPQTEVPLCNDFTCGKCEICVIANAGS